MLHRFSPAPCLVSFFKTWRSRGPVVLSQKDIAKKMVDRREEGLEQKIGEVSWLLCPIAYGVIDKKSVCLVCCCKHFFVHSTL